jgi:DNA-directed RNA polymerase subunit RPC12/RpoP
LIAHLPCKKCGSSLPILKGSIVQCPYCGAKNFYMESFYTLKYYLSDILNISSLYKSKKVNPKEILRRKILIESYFNEIKSSFKEYRHLIITKLDSINVDPVKLFYLIRASGNFEIIIDRFLLNYLEEDSSKKRYLEFRDKAYIINKSLLGLYYSYLAKNSTLYSKCFRFYQLAENNYQNIVDYCKITDLENYKPHLYKTAKFYSILVKFTIIIKNILDKNPKLFSENLEELICELEKIYKSDIHSYNLHKQIENIVQLERDTCILLENIRIDDPFLSTAPLNEVQIETADENLNEVNRVRNWINNLSEKYQKYQNGLLKLHSGRIIKYLGSYREEFIAYKNKNAEKFDQILGSMVKKALESYNYETVEAIESLSYLMQKNIYNGNLIDKLKIRHDDLIEMDEMLKNFVNNLFKKPLLRNLESEYYKELISIISGKHTEFDKHILKYINQMLKQFEDIRSKRVLSLEEQRKQFISEIKPNLQKLIDLSFTLNEEILPYPLFIDIKIPNQKLKVNNPETLTLIIENPNITDIKNIKIYFFLHDSFQNKLKFTSIKKLKANERRKIKSRIHPKEKGTFPSMVMIEYQHINKTFWMPSIKFKLEVEETKRIAFYPMLIKEYYQAQATNILKFVRSYV